MIERSSELFDALEIRAKDFAARCLDLIGDNKNLGDALKDALAMNKELADALKDAVAWIRLAKAASKVGAEQANLN
jgi:hypothetical protein